MPNKYIKRSLEPMIGRAAKEFSAVVLTGPRQSGKTTLLKHAPRGRTWPRQSRSLRRILVTGLLPATWFTPETYAFRSVQR
jgi:ABC-type phosphate/phosphonate transport system ATPase subunit